MARSLWSWRDKIASISLLAAVAATPAMGKDAAIQPGPAFDAYLKPQMLATLPDGRHFNFVCMGEGGPTVILDAGGGNWSMSWFRFQPELAKFARVCAIDRPGYGFSDPGPMPRDAAANGKDLHDALQAAGIRPPYVLVAHSISGFYARLFAYKHPDEVAGMLLIDPAHDHPDRIWARFGLPLHSADELAAHDAQLRKCVEMAMAGQLVPGGPCVPHAYPDYTEAMRELFYKLTTGVSFQEVLASEASSREKTVNELDAARRGLGALPLIVLTHGVQNDIEYAVVVEKAPESVGRREFAAHIAADDDVARDSTVGQNRAVDGAGHMIFADRPAAVIAAFREVLEAARKRTGRNAQ